ncbi:hypothetical protein GLOIN_2v1488591 [Rhizophagus clarus]|uniref:Uncharacterized protein n=1 Tax=Rhizophagus clarus TaxID=94130 RepID=A0A8H3KSE0_9GLOM|nr:hypothetical protein GLOIN_2v1488591 [Rhizophagus clarus]
MTKRRGVTEKDKATKAAKTTKTIRTYVANSSRDYNKERDERREEGSEHEQDNLHGQDVDIGEGNNRQDDDIERIILEENENDESESEEEIPVQFGAMTNQLQICNWLVLHPSVLHLANKMLDASTKQPSTNLPLTTSTSSPSDNDNYRLIDEEMKCLFLRTRNPPDHAFDKITQKILGMMLIKAKRIRQIVKSGYTESSDPTDEEVNNFISREVVLKRILSRYVSAIDFTKLSETSLDKLIEFSRKCFKIVWVETESANIKEKVKELDVITEDLEIPSRSGRNIASSLKLHLFS